MSKNVNENNANETVKEKRRVGYARVSSMGQDLKTQMAQLKAEGCTKIFKEKMTGTKTDRPEFNKLLDYLEESDTLVVSKLDRLARNTKEGIEVIENLFAKGVRVHVLNVGLLENTTMGKFFIQTMLAVAEMERNLIMERTSEGKAYAKKNNPKFKEGRPKIDKEKMEMALNMLETHTYAQVVKATEISKSTLIRAKKERDANRLAEEL